MSYVDENLNALIGRFAEEDHTTIEVWQRQAVRSVVRHRYELEEALKQARAIHEERYGRIGS